MEYIAYIGNNTMSSCNMVAFKNALENVILPNMKKDENGNFLENLTLVKRNKGEEIMRVTIYNKEDYYKLFNKN